MGLFTPIDKEQYKEFFQGLSSGTVLLAYEYEKGLDIAQSYCDEMGLSEDDVIVNRLPCSQNPKKYLSIILKKR